MLYKCKIKLDSKKMDIFFKICKVTFVHLKFITSLAHDKIKEHIFI